MNDKIFTSANSKYLYDKTRNISEKKIINAVVAGGHSDLVLQSLKIAYELKILNSVIIGPIKETELLMKQLDIPSSIFQLIDANGDDDVAEKMVNIIANESVDMVIKGQIHTDKFMGALVHKDAGLRIGKRFTHIFYMDIPNFDRPLLISDAALNISFEGKTGESILQNIVELAHAVDIQQPKVAILSATEEINKNMLSSIQANELANWGNKNIKNAYIQGPLAFDNAISIEAVKIKSMSGAVVGKADCLVVPSIESGNILFKSLVYLNDANAGGIVLGAKLPIILTSRADQVPSRLLSFLLAILQSHASS